MDVSLLRTRVKGALGNPLFRVRLMVIEVQVNIRIHSGQLFLATDRRFNDCIKSSFDLSLWTSLKFKFNLVRVGALFECG